MGATVSSPQSLAGDFVSACGQSRGDIGVRRNEGSKLLQRADPLTHQYPPRSCTRQSQFSSLAVEPRRTYVRQNESNSATGAIVGAPGRCAMSCFAGTDAAQYRSAARVRTESGRVLSPGPMRTSPVGGKRPGAIACLLPVVSRQQRLVHLSDSGGLRLLDACDHSGLPRTCVRA